jgi:hypothetical protein
MYIELSSFPDTDVSPPDTVLIHLVNIAAALRVNVVIPLVASSVKVPPTIFKVGLGVTVIPAFFIV